jgi:hypothetical protein
LGTRPAGPYRFVEEAPRDGDYLFLRKPTRDRKHAYWSVKMRAKVGPRGAKWSTKCLLEELERAVVRYIGYFAELRNLHLNGVSPLSRLVTDVLSDFVTMSSQRCHGAETIGTKRHDAVLGATKLLIPYVDGMRVGDIGPGFTDPFMAWATADKPNGAGITHNSACGVLYLLRHALESVLVTATSRYVAPFEIPAVKYSPIEVFSPDDIVRVPIAAETGWIWDTEANDWMTEIDPQTGLRVRVVRRSDSARAARPYGRLFWMGVIFGARLTVILNTSWTAESGGPWLDLEHGIYYKLGSKEDENGVKLKGACQIPPEHLPMLRDWRADDARRGFNRLFHLWDGGSPFEPNRLIWYALLEAAGARGLKIHCLRHTCVMIMRTSGVPMEAAMAYLEATARTLRRYGKWDFRVQGPAVQALGSMAGYRKWHDEEIAARALFTEADALAAVIANDNAAA